MGPLRAVAPSERVEGIARLRGTSAYLPGDVRTTDEVERRIRAASPGVAFPRGAIRRITGIESRRVAADHEQTSDLAAAAARECLEKAEVAPSEVDALIFAAASQDLAEPATANLVQEKVGTSCPVFDVKNACNSFLSAVEVAEALIGTGLHRHVLVATGEIPSRGIKWSVRDFDDLRLSFPGYTFGDAGAAALVSAADGARGIFYRRFKTVSRFWDIGTMPGGGSMHPRGEEWTYFRGDGSRLGAAFSEVGSGIFDEALHATGTTVADYARVLVHQVTVPFLKTFSRRTGVPFGKLVLTLPEFGNVAAASMPMQFAIAAARGDIKPGDLVAWVGLAGGISIGVMLMEV